VGLHLSAAIPMRLDSPGLPSHDYSGDRLDAHDALSPITSSPLHTIDASGTPRASVTKIINALRKWNLKCLKCAGQ